MKLSLIIPAYNEEKRIRKTLEMYITKFNDVGIDFEIIVEMDGCTDKTPEIVKKLSLKFPKIKYIEFKKRLGKGGGLLKGFEVSTGDYVGFVDADGAIEPLEFMKLLKEVKKGYDGAIGSRRAKGAIIKNQYTIRKNLSKIFNLLVRFLFALPFKDTQCGAKVFRREVIKKIISEVNVHGFVTDVNLLFLAVRKGFKVKEVGIKWIDKYGSKVNIPKAILEMSLELLKLRLYYSPFRFIFNWR